MLVLLQAVKQLQVFLIFKNVSFTWLDKLLSIALTECWISITIYREPLAYQQIIGCNHNYMAGKMFDLTSLLVIYAEQLMRVS